MHRVLHIPELLALIFISLPSAAKVNAACVCTTWSAIALDVLWREVDDFRRLVQLLVPVMDDPDDGSYSFTRPPEPADWARFSRYALRVRCLRFHLNLALPDPSVFDHIARTRTRLHVLPHLHTLAWTHPLMLPLAALFMHEHVRTFVAWLPTAYETDLRRLVREIVARMPLLTHLDIRTLRPMKAIEPEMLDLFGGLPRLQNIVLPRYHFTQRVAEALAQLPRLQIVEFQYPRVVEQGCGDPADVRAFAPHLGERAFASLCELSLAVQLKDLVKMLEGAFALHLRVLYVDSTHAEDPGTVHALLQAVSEQCQMLEHLTVVCAMTSSGPSRRPSAEEQISFETLKPLLACPNLVYFEIAHKYPLRLTQEDVEALARSWPALETLDLNADLALLSQEPTLTLRALVPFAKYCPNLRKLALFVNATAADIPDGALGVMGQLQQLGVGVSCIAEEGPVALFLSRVCPVACTLAYGVVWDMDEVPLSEGGAFAAEIYERCARWRKVSELLPLLTRMRMEERVRTRALVEEVEDLRVRVRVLSDGVRTRDGCILS